MNRLGAGKQRAKDLHIVQVATPVAAVVALDFVLDLFVVTVD